jgi:predicted nucleotidyltransferase
MQRHLDELVERLKKAYADRLLSVVLYGSAAAGDHQNPFSDLNVLCVLREITPRELAAAEPIVRWWREKDNPSPLLVTEEEIRNSTDCFPIEFHDIKEQGRVLYGPDLLATIEVHDQDYRAEVEHELRAKLLRLRQKAAGIMQDQPLLLRLMADSVSTFCVLFRHALALHGEPRKGPKREILEQAGRRFGIDTAPFLTLLDLRDSRTKARDIQVISLLDKYMSQIQVVATAVNALDLRGEETL